MQDPRLITSPLSCNDNLIVSVFIATLIHVGILLGIHFKAPQTSKHQKSIEITLSHAPLKKAPKQAKFLAADHQLGAGDQTHKPAPPKQVLPAPDRQAPPVEKPPEAHMQPAQAHPKPPAQKIITQQQAVAKIAATDEVQEHVQHEATVDHPKLNAEALQYQIAQLGEQIRNSQQSSEDSKIKFVHSVSTHKYLAAQYVKDWEDKVERTGNLNYPSAAKKPGVSQSLTLDVGINADGSIYSMRVVRSSGNTALDEAAKRIVKMSAPFAPLPTELLKEVNVLVITRVWKFSDETGMTAR